MGWWHFGLLGCGARSCVGFGLLWSRNETVVTERKCARCGSVCVFVCVWGRWVNHTGITDTWQKDFVSALCEGDQKKLLSKMGSVNLWCFLVDCDLHTILFVCVQGAVVLRTKNMNKCSTTDGLWLQGLLCSLKCFYPASFWIILSRLAMVYIHPMSQWSSTG